MGARVHDVLRLLGARHRKTCPVDEPDLQVPHPEILKRSFVLVPLLELDPALVHPATGETLLVHLSELKTRPPVKRGSRLWN